MFLPFFSLRFLFSLSLSLSPSTSLCLSYIRKELSHSLSISQSFLVDISLATLKLSLPCQ
jgi:hypothetical protein